MFHYSINVAKKVSNPLLGDQYMRYAHFFRVELDTTYSVEQARAVHAELLQKFPAPEYVVTVNRSQPHVSERIDAI